jgi:hypothetical protein
MSLPQKYDFLGQAIIEGDFVVWAVRQGSALWLNGGQVLEVFEDRRLRVEPTHTETTLACSKRTVLLSANAHVVRIPEF